jgi:hypothetical protein
MDKDQKVELGLVFQYGDLPTSRAARKYIADALQRHQHGDWGDRTELVSHHVNRKGFDITIVTQPGSLATYVMRGEVYRTDYEKNPLRLSAAVLKHFQEVTEHRTGLFGLRSVWKPEQPAPKQSAPEQSAPEQSGLAQAVGF